MFWNRRLKLSFIFLTVLTPWHCTADLKALWEINEWNPQAVMLWVLFCQSCVLLVIPTLIKMKNLSDSRQHAETEAHSAWARLQIDRYFKEYEARLHNYASLEGVLIYESDLCWPNGRHVQCNLLRAYEKVHDGKRQLIRFHTPMHRSAWEEAVLGVVCTMYVLNIFLCLSLPQLRIQILVRGFESWFTVSAGRLWSETGYLSSLSSLCVCFPSL